MPRLTAQEKVRRDAEVVADRSAGLRWATIAGRHDLSERQAQEIVKNHRAAEQPFDSRDPVDAVTEVVEQLDSIIEKFAMGRPTLSDARRQSRHGVTDVLYLA